MCNKKLDKQLCGKWLTINTTAIKRANEAEKFYMCQKGDGKIDIWAADIDLFVGLTRYITARQS